MDAAQKAQAQTGPIQQQIMKGVNTGVEQGIKRIATELTAGGLGAMLQMPEGMPTHIGTLPQPGGGPGAPGQPGQPGQPGMQENARQASGNLPPARGGPPGGMAPNNGNVAGNAPKPGNQPISPGVG
jgi:hypothetical protein